MRIFDPRTMTVGLLLSLAAIAGGPIGATPAAAADAKTYTNVTQAIFDCMRNKSENKVTKSVPVIGDFDGWAEYSGAANGTVRLKSTSSCIPDPAQLTYNYDAAGQKLSFKITNRATCTKLFITVKTVSENDVWEGFDATYNKCKAKQPAKS